MNTSPNPRMISSSSTVDGKSPRLSIPFDSGSRLQGIIHHLNSKFGGNVHDKNIVNITASSCNRRRLARNLADLENNNFFNSQDQPNQWFCYDFQNRQIIPTHYSINSYRYTNYNPQSWVIETSIDGVNWTEVDRKEQCRDLCVVRQIRTFPIANGTACRCIRFRHTATNPAGNHHLCLTSFEVFGTLLEPI
jgi:hypothetical protein